MYIQLIGLGGLLKTPSIKIRRVVCLAIANSYDAEQDAFIINGRPCRITLEDVAHITGMPCHGKKHVPSNLDDNMELWKKLKDRNDTKITLRIASQDERQQHTKFCQAICLVHHRQICMPDNTAVCGQQIPWDC